MTWFRHVVYTSPNVWYILVRKDQKAFLLIYFVTFFVYGTYEYTMYYVPTTVPKIILYDKKDTSEWGLAIIPVVA